MAGSSVNGRRKEPPPVSYERFRTGFTFKEIAAQVAAEYREMNRRAREGFGEYRTFTRRAVLRRWRTLKLELWEAYHGNAEENGTGD